MTQHQADAPTPWGDETIDKEAFARDDKTGRALDVVNRYLRENFPEVMPAKLRILTYIPEPSAAQNSILDAESAPLIEALLKTQGLTFRKPGEPIPYEASFLEATAANAYTRGSVVALAKKLAGDRKPIEVALGEVLSFDRIDLSREGFVSGLGRLGHSAGELHVHGIKPINWQDAVAVKAEKNTGTELSL